MSGGLQAQLIQIAPIILMVVLFYFMLIRPQQTRAKQHAAAIAAVKRGDNVVLSNGMEEIAAGQPPRRHPTVEAVAAAGYPLSALAEMAEARMADLDATPFETEGQVLAYVDATAGAVTMLAAWRLDPKADPHAVQDAARAYGLAGLWRLKRAGVQRLPADWTQGDVRRRVGEARAKANVALKALPIAAFPAAAPAALAMAQLGARELGELEKRLRLTWAVATGRV